MNLKNKKNSDITIGLIGGSGQMGSLFAPLFKKQQFKIIISDLKTKLTNEELVKNSDIVIITVPILKTEQIIKEILPHTRKDQILMDFTSLKTFPVKQMLKSKSEVIGLHPMFGPGVKDIKGQTIVMCPARTTNEKFIESIFNKLGANIETTTPKKHDEIMSIIQVFTHFHTILMGKTLKDLNIDIKEISKFMSPIYRLEFDIISRIFSQDPDLYGPILMLNPNKNKISRTIKKNTDILKKIMAINDYQSFNKKFLETREYLGEFAKDAMQESNQIIKHLSSIK
ncbi:prephenate dehydrogenase/arogenate dehydrogenase family protein [Patescibacteria group bacterium]|nr:prephenate dehydrogenase/arogenate dehydrogenase family protein [Patescibacteria group bacterium]